MSTKSPNARSPAGARSPEKSPDNANKSPIRKSQGINNNSNNNSKRSLSLNLVPEMDNNSQNTEITGANPNQSPGQPNQPPKALEVKKPPRDKKKKRPEGGALSQDFESFDILWFDLTTKTR